MDDEFKHDLVNTGGLVRGEIGCPEPCRVDNYGCGHVLLQWQKSSDERSEAQELDQAVDLEFGQYFFIVP